MEKETNPFAELTKKGNATMGKTATFGTQKNADIGRTVNANWEKDASTSTGTNPFHATATMTHLLHHNHTTTTNNKETTKDAKVPPAVKDAIKKDRQKHHLLNKMVTKVRVSSIHLHRRMLPYQAQF